MLDKELLAFGQRFHGHKCPVLPMGLRAAQAIEATDLPHEFATVLRTGGR